MCWPRGWVHAVYDLGAPPHVEWFKMRSPNAFLMFLQTTRAVACAFHDPRELHFFLDCLLCLLHSMLQARALAADTSMQNSFASANGDLIVAFRRRRLQKNDRAVEASGRDSIAPLVCAFSVFIAAWRGREWREVWWRRMWDEDRIKFALRQTHQCCISLMKWRLNFSLRTTLRSSGNIEDVKRTESNILMIISKICF